MRTTTLNKNFMIFIQDGIQVVTEKVKYNAKLMKRSNSVRKRTMPPVPASAGNGEEVPLLEA